MSEYRNIYRREYDKPLNAKGKEKTNELIGSFRVVSVICKDAYADTFIGANYNDDVFLITGSEVAGFNGGMAYGATPLPDLMIRESVIAEKAEDDGDIERLIAALP